MKQRQLAKTTLAHTSKLKINPKNLLKMTLSLKNIPFDKPKTAYILHGFLHGFLKFTQFLKIDRASIFKVFPVYATGGRYRI